jgi:D-aminopeptidase
VTTSDETRRQAIARDLSRRQQLASLDELRVMDRVMLVIEHLRDGEADVFDRLPQTLLITLNEIKADDQRRAEPHEQARAEMLGEGGEGGAA